jgi:hypothetical protein
VILNDVNFNWNCCTASFYRNTVRYFVSSSGDFATVFFIQPSIRLTIINLMYLGLRINQSHIVIKSSRTTNRVNSKLMIYPDEGHRGDLRNTGLGLKLTVPVARDIVEFSQNQVLYMCLLIITLFRLKFCCKTCFLFKSIQLYPK